MVVHMLLADFFLEFLLPYKGAAKNKTDKTQICVCDFKSFLTEILQIFWEELSRTIQQLFGTFYNTNVVCYFLAGFTPQSCFFDCTIP